MIFICPRRQYLIDVVDIKVNRDVLVPVRDPRDDTIKNFYPAKLIFGSNLIHSKDHEEKSTYLKAEPSGGFRYVNNYREEGVRISDTVTRYNTCLVDENGLSEKFLIVEDIESAKLYFEITENNVDSLGGYTDANC